MLVDGKIVTVSLAGRRSVSVILVLDWRVRRRNMTRGWRHDVSSKVD